MKPSSVFVLLMAFVLNAVPTLSKNVTVSNKYRTRAIITRGLYLFYPIFTAVYIVEQLVLQPIYILNKEILQLLGLKSTVFNQVRFQIKIGIIMGCVQFIMIKGD